MILSHLQGHSLLQALKMWFFVQLCNSWQHRAVDELSLYAGIGIAFSHVCLFVCLFVSALTGNSLSYQHQTWYMYTL